MVGIISVKGRMHQLPTRSPRPKLLPCIQKLLGREARVDATYSVLLDSELLLPPFFENLTFILKRNVQQLNDLSARRPQIAT